MEKTKLSAVVKSLRKEYGLTQEDLAGILTEDGGEYRFCYDETYLAHEELLALSSL